MLIAMVDEIYFGTNAGGGSCPPPAITAAKVASGGLQWLRALGAGCPPCNALGGLVQKPLETHLKFP